jgi:hypothetical protein
MSLNSTYLGLLKRAPDYYIKGNKPSCHGTKVKAKQMEIFEKIEL